MKWITREATSAMFATMVAVATFVGAFLVAGHAYACTSDGCTKTAGGGCAGGCDPETCDCGPSSDNVTCECT
jgi:hypothetical protein